MFEDDVAQGQIITVEIPDDEDTNTLATKIQEECGNDGAVIKMIKELFLISYHVAPRLGPRNPPAKQRRNSREKLF